MPSIAKLLWPLFVFFTEGLTIAVAGGIVLGIFAGLTMLITVFFHRHQYVIR